jgi:starch-binding outer membrane protein, SusD/RagB family
MKKIFGKLLLISSLFLVSCEEELLEPFTPGAVTEELAFTTSSDIQAMMNSTYAVMTPVSEIEFNSIFTDEAGIGYANGGQGKDDNYAFFVNSGSGSPNGIWATLYVTANYASRVIKYADYITPVDAADADLLNKLRAEAYTVRAYCHTQLLSYFSTNPKDLNALGVIKCDQVYPTSYQGVRVANSEIYNLIDADLLAAENLFNGLSSYTPSSIEANKTFAIALKARSYALRGDYPNALVYANQVISSQGALANFATYKNVFHIDAASSEIIFKLKKTNGQTRIGNVWASVNSTVSGSPFFEMGRSLYNVMNPTNLASATTYTITAISGSTITIPGHTMAVGDTFVPQERYPSTALPTAANALQPGKIYYVRSVSGNNITIQQTLGTTGAGTAAVAISPSATGLAIVAKSNFGDVRFDTCLHYTSIVDFNYATSSDFLNTDKLAIRKYPGTAATGNLVNDIKISRLSEMYLIKAEAQIAANDLTGAAQTLKQIRDARYNTPQAAPTFANATDAWKAVLNERRIELAFEGFRFIDLKRIGSLAGEGILRDPQDCAFNGACGLPVTDYRFALPIPTVESNPNGGILSQQNPGY